MNLIDVPKKFGTAEACVNLLEKMRWPNGVSCLKCEGPRVTRLHTNETERKRKDPKTGAVTIKRVPARFVHQCMNPGCGHQFSVTTETTFNDTHLELEKWFMAVALMVNAKKGLSALQLKRDLKIAYKTAWFLSHRIRKAMGLADGADDTQLEGTVEVDETHEGGNTTSAAHGRSTTRRPWLA